MRFSTALLLAVLLGAPTVLALDLEEAAIEGRLGYFTPTGASDTFDANFGGGEDITFGAGGLWKFDNGLYLEGAFDYYNQSGDKVYLGGGSTQSTGFGTEITIIPITMTGGWSFMKGASWSPMVGAGLGFYLVDVPDGEADNSLGFHFNAGAEFLKQQNFGLMAEVRMSFVPDAIGHAGTSAFYGEDDVGGITLTIKALWRYWR